MRTKIALSLLALIGSAARAAELPVPADVAWNSPTAAGISGKLYLPASPARPTPTIIYCKNLASPRLGTESDEAIIADMLKDGEQVLVLDYAKNPAARSPNLNADIYQLRDDISKKKLLAANAPDVARIYILPEGYRIQRNVPYYKDPAAHGGALAMDIFYPAKPEKPVATLMEITCDNDNRMGLASLQGCHDTWIEGALFAGFASAMVDHPNPIKYPGFFTMPDGLIRMKSAVRTLRAEAKTLGMTDKIGGMGFSRGSPLTALLALTAGHKEFEPEDAKAFNLGVSSSIQAAQVHGERYDYTILKADDPMYKRYETAWGGKADKPELWHLHSAMDFVTKDAPPMFLNTSMTEQPIYKDQLAMFDKKLTEIGVEHIYQVDDDARQHRVAFKPETLAAEYAFFHKHLDK